MDLITVNQEKCTTCGICVKECPSFVLSMGEHGPEAVAPMSCVVCGHCVAVCPTEAIDNSKTPLDRQVDVTKFSKLTAEEAERFLRSRRSIRSYKKTSVPRAELLKLVEVAHFAPTAANLQGISYVIVEDEKILKEAIELSVQSLESNVMLGDRFANYIRAYRENGIDIVLRGAPNLILATATTEFPRGRENSVFSLAYLELYAPTRGLGTCWAGLLEACALLDNSPMLKLFNIPEGKKITGAVMVGYPQYSYKRLVDREPLEVAFL